MEIITGHTGTAHVVSSDDRALNAGIFGKGNYVLDVGSKLAVATRDALAITLSDGDIMMNGCHARIRFGETETVNFNANQQGSNRIDLVVAHYELNSGIESVELKVVEGTPTSGTPTAPTYTQGNILAGDTVAEFPLYSVQFNGATMGNVVSQFKVVNYPIVSAGDIVDKVGKGSVSSGDTNIPTNNMVYNYALKPVQNLSTVYDCINDLKTLCTHFSTKFSEKGLYTTQDELADNVTFVSLSTSMKNYKK